MVSFQLELIFHAPVNVPIAKEASKSAMREVSGCTNIFHLHKVEYRIMFNYCLIL